ITAYPRKISILSSSVAPAPPGVRVSVRRSFPRCWSFFLDGCVRAYWSAGHGAVALLAIHPVLLKQVMAIAELDVGLGELAGLVRDGIGLAVRAFALLRVFQTVAVVPRVVVRVGHHF